MDRRTEEFVEEFNRQWDPIRSAYPIYAALESIYQAASVAELLNRCTEQGTHRELLNSLAHLSAPDGFLMPMPRQVESIAVLHTIRSGPHQHHVLIASGGVAVDADQTLASEVETSPTLGTVARPQQNQPGVIQRWWWD